jgi:phosphohistidine swiveling domain-containing protein
LFPRQAGLSPATAGWKFYNLQRLPAGLDVPPGACITVDAFREALGAERLRYLLRLGDDLRATVGCFLLSSLEGLQDVMRDLDVPGAMREELRAFLEAALGPLDGRRFAVRSSAAHEDSPRSSFAGVYRSYLHLAGFDAVCDAVAACWRAYFSYPAVAARLRAGDFSAVPEMAVIVQEMVPARYAGVAFSADPAGGGPLVEYVAGDGEALVSGAKAAARFHPAGGEGPAGVAAGVAAGVDAPAAVDAPAGDAAPALGEVAAAIPVIAAAFGGDVDIEWAHDGRRLYILQVRPVAARRRPAAPGARSGAAVAPYLEIAPLYRDAGLPRRVDLGECRDVYAVYVTKRARAYRLADREGVATGAAHVVCFNAAGLRDGRGELEAALGATRAPEVVVDVADNIRQIIVKKPGLYDFITGTFALGTAPGDATHTVIVRDFVRGQYGFISQLVAPHGLLVELSREGLLAINRGIAACTRVVVRDGDRPLDGPNVAGDGDPAAIDDLRPALPRILAFTRALDHEFGGAQLEWVLEGGVPYFVDYSRRAAEAAAGAGRCAGGGRGAGHVAVARTGGGGGGNIVVSAGVARGPVLRVAADDVLERLSVGPAVSVDRYDDAREHAALREILAAVQARQETGGRPIILVQRPYAILSALLEHVAGFVFAEGSLLCHLAIMLREHGVPAIICRQPEAWAAAEGAGGREALICDGELTIF